MLKESRGQEFAGRVVIITGAGRGMGLGIARAFGHEGATVIIAEIVAEWGRAAARSLTAEGCDAHAVELDVRDGDACTVVADEVTRRHGRIDVLVNNAGLAIIGPSEDQSPEDWKIQVDVMLTGLFLMTQAAARSMIALQAGTIVNIASIGGLGGWPMRAAYNASKAGVINLTETLACEWAQHNIRINAVSPGVTRTEMVNQAIRDGVVSMDQYVRRIPAGRLAEVTDIADAVLFLASDRASFITGANLRVDGGWASWGNPHALGFPEGSENA